MNLNNASLIVLILILVLCCGPMLLMMAKGRGSKREQDKTEDKPEQE